MDGDRNCGGRNTLARTQTHVADAAREYLRLLFSLVVEHGAVPAEAVNLAIGVLVFLMLAITPGWRLMSGYLDSLYVVFLRWVLARSLKGRERRQLLSRLAHRAEPAPPDPKYWLKAAIVLAVYGVVSIACALGFR